MEVCFRVDASLQIGTGHVMRCLALADAMRERGAVCTFVCRPHIGHLLDLIAQRGHKSHALHKSQENFKATAAPVHAAWLGTSWADDAEQTRQALASQAFDWLVVDHYALDQHWEKALRSSSKRIMVIDDLADRPHDCDLLLDQTHGRPETDYVSLVPKGCQILCGSQYALLRSEFAALREWSLKRREKPVLKELLIAMGGVDKDNFTGSVLNAVRMCSLPEDCRLTVVMGQTAPWLKEITALASTMHRPTRVLAGVNDMAKLMADSDLAIGAAGGTSWERCCLGLPSIMLVVADNQLQVAKGLEQSGAALLCLSEKNWENHLSISLGQFCSDAQKLLSISMAASKITNGTGSHTISQLMNLA